MTYKEFNKYRDEFISQATLLSDYKSIEYTISNIDKHYNFKNVADRLGITPQQSLMVYVLKHVDAICNDAKTGKQVSDETVRSRCQDIMNYAILYASLHEEQKTTKGTNHDSNSQRSGADTSENGRLEKKSTEPDKWNQLKRSSKS